MKLFVALGPGDIVAAHRSQMEGRTVLSETSIIFSGQLLEYCRLRGIETLALSHNSRIDWLRDGPLRLQNRPRGFTGRGRALYHLSNISYAIYLALRARLFGAHLAVIDSGSAHYFALAIFRLFGIPVAVNFHNTLWPNGFKPVRGSARFFRALDSWFFRHIAAGALGVSPECGIQVRLLARRPLPFFEYRSQFRLDGFRAIPSNRARNPFRVLFAGRVERNKGVFDLLDIADRLRSESTIPVVFEICGDGSALNDLKQYAEQKALTDIVYIQGRLARTQLLNAYARADAVIVPTRADFCEGLPLVCAEAVLSHLPIITSRLSNAIPVLGQALLEAQPQDIESYVAVIKRLAEDSKAYDCASKACAAHAQQFTDRSRSYPAALDSLLVCLFPRWERFKDYDTLFARVL